VGWGGGDEMRVIPSGRPGVRAMLQLRRLDGRRRSRRQYREGCSQVIPVECGE
jgi:hypothetical protein